VVENHLEMVWKGGWSADIGRIWYGMRSKGMCGCLH